MATGIETQLDKPPSSSEEGARDKEKLIPVFTVWKNSSILKYIFVIGDPPSSSDSPAVSSGDFKETLLVGRHPKCKITLEHPSISRFHLQIRSIPSRKSLSVIDISSRHGTWISGHKVEHGVRVEMLEGDVLKLGRSTRGYILSWVPLSHACDMKNPFVPPLGESESIDRMQDEARPHLDDGLHYAGDENETDDDSLENFDVLLSDMNTMSPMQQLGVHAPLMFEVKLTDIIEIQPVWDRDAEYRLNKSSFPRTLQPSEQPVLELNNETGLNEIFSPETLQPRENVQNEEVADVNYELETLFADSYDVKSPKNMSSMEMLGQREMQVIDSFLPFNVEEGLSFEDVPNKELTDIHHELDTLFASVFVAADINNMSSMEMLGQREMQVNDSIHPFNVEEGLSFEDVPNIELTDIHHELDTLFASVFVAADINNMSSMEIPGQREMQVNISIHPFNNSSKGEIKPWTMVVDTACLLNKESRKALQLLQGVRGTGLFIPSVVMIDLYYKSKDRSIFRRNTECLSALQLIRDCMLGTKWWIHLQSSAEDRDHTPTTEDPILQYGLFLRKMQQNQGRVVLLSNDVPLKIKAIAEGLLCETAEEFRESLVTRSSERFLWPGSCPRGPTWCCHDELPSDESAKGLKLLLPHNSKHAR